MKFIWAAILIAIVFVVLAWQQGALEPIINNLNTGKTGATIRAF